MIDGELGREMIAHMGIAGEVRSVPGGVTFTVGHRSLGGCVVLGVSRQFITAEMTPADALELARNLTDAANNAGGLIAPAVVAGVAGAGTMRRKILRSATLALAILVVAILLGLASR